MIEFWHIKCWGLINQYTHAEVSQLMHVSWEGGRVSRLVTVSKSIWKHRQTERGGVYLPLFFVPPLLHHSSLLLLTPQSVSPRIPLQTGWLTTTFTSPSPSFNPASVYPHTLRPISTSFPRWNSSSMMPDATATAAASSASNINISSSDSESSRHRHRAQGDAERPEQQQHSAASQHTFLGECGGSGEGEYGRDRWMWGWHKGQTAYPSGRMNNAALCYAACPSCLLCFPDTTVPADVRVAYRRSCGSITSNARLKL